MPSGIVKAVVLVDDLDAVLALMTDVIGVAPIERFESSGEQAAIGLGWPAESGATRGAVVGSRQGILELVEIPAALRATVRPGVAALSFGTRDTEDGATRARAAGYAVDGPHDLVGVDGSTSSLVRMDAGGVVFELIRFGSA
jgi:hypothetical protein